MQSIQLLTWILSARLLTTADESCPNAAPASLLETLFNMSAWVQWGSWLPASLRSKLTKAFSHGFSFLPFPFDFPLCNSVEQNSIDFLKNKSTLVPLELPRLLPQSFIITMHTLSEVRDFWTTGNINPVYSVILGNLLWSQFSEKQCRALRTDTGNMENNIANDNNSNNDNREQKKVRDWCW